MALLLDTSVLVEAERKRMRLAQIPVGRSGELYVSAITISELLHGQHRAQTTEQRARRVDFFEDLMTGVVVLDFDYDTAVVHARIWSELRLVGMMIGSHDLLVAATALSRRHAVVTNNVREFSRVPELEVISPGW